jgi:hypothetical protein
MIWSSQMGRLERTAVASKVHWFALSGLVFIPMLWGGVQANRDRTPGLTSLPLIETSGGKETWHLLSVSDSNAIVVRLLAEHYRAVVRVMPMTQLTSVQQQKR